MPKSYRNIWVLILKIPTIRTGNHCRAIYLFNDGIYLLPSIPRNLKRQGGMDKGALFTTSLPWLPQLLHSSCAFTPKCSFGFPGMNAFFAYTVCVSMGPIILAICFNGNSGSRVSSLFFLPSQNVREKIVHSLPTSLQTAIGVGIGLLLPLSVRKMQWILVKNDANIGLIRANILTLASCL